MNQVITPETLYPIIQTLCADDYNELLKKMQLNQKIINDAANALHKIIFRERRVPNGYVRNGKTPTGRQKYLNPQTSRSISDTHHSIVHYSKKSYEQWLMFIKCMLYGLSLRKSASEVGISTTTAFAWRHKVIEAMKDYQEVVKLSGEIEVDETYFLLNMKGPWKGKPMPRSAKKKGEPAVLRGVSNEHVCVLIALDENDQVLTKVVGQGNPWKDDIFDAINGKVKAGSHITSDSKSSYFDIAHQLECSVTQIPSGEHTKDEYSLGVINNYHSELKTWFRRFRGVSTKHLEGYLMWFRFMKYLKYQLEYDKHLNAALKYVISNHVSIKSSDIHQRDWPIDIFKPYQYLS